MVCVSRRMDGWIPTDMNEIPTCTTTAEDVRTDLEGLLERAHGDDALRPEPHLGGHEALVGVRGVAVMGRYKRKID